MNSRFSVPYSAVLLLALWLSSRPYEGIIHDGRLYLALALRHLEPSAFDDDLFFAFGSQDAFSFFTPAYAGLLQSLGPSLGHVLLVYVGLIVWLGALLLFLSAVFPTPRLWLVAAMGVILLNPFYGYQRFFSYGEPFGTARLFSEAAVLASLSVAFRGKIALAALGVAAAGLLHPLMALPGAGVVAYMAAARWRWLWLAYTACAIGGAGLALLGTEPFARAVDSINDGTLEIIRKRSAHAFVLQGSWDSGLNTLPHVISIAIGGMMAGEQQRRLAWIVGAVAALGVIVTLVAADLAGNALGTNLQTWRALWLLSVLGNAYAATLLVRLWPSKEARGFLIAALSAGILERLISFPPIVSTMFWIFICAALVWQLVGVPIPRLAQLALWSFGGTGLSLLGFLAWTAIARRISLPGAVLASGSIIVLFAAVGLLILKLLRDEQAKLFNWVLPGILLLGIAATSDQRSPWQRYVESDADVRKIEAFLGDAHNVYWEDGLELLWFKLRRSSYFSCDQGAGVMFFAATAIEFQRRSDGLRALRTSDFDKVGCRATAAVGLGAPIKAEQLSAVCRSLPELDAIVLRRAIEGAEPASVWRAPVSLITKLINSSPISNDTFHLYRCANYR